MLVPQYSKMQRDAACTYVVWLLVIVERDVLANEDTNADARQVEAVQELRISNKVKTPWG